MSVFVSIKDVQELTRLCPSAAQRKLAQIRKHFKIAKYQPVTILEYCNYNRLDVDFVMEILASMGKKQR